MNASPPQSSPILSQALLSLRPNSHIAHPYPRSDKGSKRGKSRPHSPSPNTFKAERGQVTTHGQRNHSRGTLVPILPPRAACCPLDRTDILLSVRPLTRCPLAARPLPSRSHRDPTYNLRKWQGMEQASFYQGAPRSHGEHPFLYDPLLFPYADACTHRQQGGTHDRLRSREPLPYNTNPSRARDPRYRTAQYADSDQLAWPMYACQNAAYTGPWGHPAGPSPTWQQPTQLSMGIHWGAHQWDYARATWQGGSPRPQPLAWAHANGSGCGTTTGLPSTGNPTTVRNPSASNLSAAEGNPLDRPPRSRSRSKRHRCKTSHSPDWWSSSSSSKSKDADSRGTHTHTHTHTHLGVQ